jgi:2-polyprenyl-3-methyl-5-hydroxy-6-metoxy-1,4-benzoquinol methylase
MDRSPLPLRRLGGRLLGALPPQAQGRVRALVGRPGPRTVPLEALDAELAEAARLFSVSEDGARRFLDDLRVALPADGPPDPFSTAYREWTWDLYRRISGRAAYATDNEASPFDFDIARVRPFPYASGSATVVGGDLAARGHLLHCIGAASADGLLPPARLVEFGPGWGNLTNDLTSTGFRVTAVEVDPRFCALLEERCPVPANLSVVQADMLAFTDSEPFDAAVFFESFHHCADHLAMLRQLHHIVRPGGPVFFASEPVQALAYPWGPRLDGLSVWSSRTYGWLELGFDARYFTAALARTGWRATRRRVGPAESAADVFVARADPSWTG